MKKWLQATKFFNIKERIFFNLLIILLLGSVIGWGLMFYYSKTKAVADYGGEYIEGIVGQPQHINPVISQSNNADEDLTQLVYSGLLKYDSRGDLIPDLAESYDISDDKTTYTFHLKKDVEWHDGQPFAAADVLYTTNILSDPAYKSPLRTNWQGITTNIVDDHTLTFQIQSSFVGFLNNLTFGILPKHIWETVTADKFSLTDLNLEPIGTGPYKYNAFQKDSRGNIISYKLVANPNYFEGKPYISKMTFDFYDSDDSILKAFNSKEIMGINSLTPQRMADIKLLQSTFIHKFDISRYFAVFINQTRSLPLADDNVRQALTYATNRQEIIDNILSGNGNPVYSPILDAMVGYSTDIDSRTFDLEKANSVLDSNGWNRGEDGMRAKNGTPLQFTLTTTDWPELAQTAEILKSEWAKAGAKVDVQTYSISDIQQNYIRPREYEALLFGQVLGADPDPYSFWHSSQKRDPGLNLSLFGDSDTDKLIEAGRIEFDYDKRASIYQDFQKKLIAETPAIFLYSPDYIYPVNKKVQGINMEDLISPSKRFSDANHWYINTKRVKK
ncbi:MAG: ABC transporter substrate-binding protein [Parcubacteria group bacterium]